MLEYHQHIYCIDNPKVSGESKVKLSPMEISKVYSDSDLFGALCKNLTGTPCTSDNGTPIMFIYSLVVNVVKLLLHCWACLR